MSEEIDEIDDNNEKNINEVLVNKQNNFTSKRKRKELINTDSENENDEKAKENESDNIKFKTSNKKEKKENQKENIEYSNNIKKPNYQKNIFNTLDKNNMGNSPNKKNLALQEKLKKIFINRDKLKFQYNKQDIPDNLKYHSDDSDSSEISGLRKSKI